MTVCLSLTTLSAFAGDPASVRFEPEPSKTWDEILPERISWKELISQGYHYGSSIANGAYIPQALVLEGTDDPRSVKMQWRVKGQWYWANEGPTWPLPELPVQTSEWMDLKVSPESWVLLPTFSMMEEAAGFGDQPDVEKIASILKKNYPASKEENLEKNFRDQVKEHGADTILSQITYTVGEIEIRFAAKGKEFPKKAQMRISIIPGC